MRPRRKPVHLILRSHFPGEPYVRRITIPKGLKTHVVEEGLGNKEMIDQYLRESNQGYPFSVMAGKYIRALREKRVRLVVGEHGTRSEMLQLSKLNDVFARAERMAINNPELENLKALYFAEAEYMNERHRLIVQKIKKQIEKEKLPLEARYGYFHSFLSADLKKAGVPSSRSLKRRIFNWADIVTRRIMHGTSPNAISRLDYKRAFVTTKFDNIFVLGYLSKIKGIEDDLELRRVNVLLYTLVERLTEEQLDDIIRTNDPTKLATYNGLPAGGILEGPTRKDLTEFLEKNSLFYQHRRIVKKNRPKIEKK